MCHGGPGLITEAREAGHVPLCVPRDPQLGEHVDGHQQRFAALAAREGVVRTVQSQEAFDDELDRRWRGPPGWCGSTSANDVREAARALAGRQARRAARPAAVPPRPAAPRGLVAS